jgi:hypothetical protein
MTRLQLAATPGNYFEFTGIRPEKEIGLVGKSVQLQEVAERPWASPRIAREPGEWKAYLP